MKVQPTANRILNQGSNKEHMICFSLSLVHPIFFPNILSRHVLELGRAPITKILKPTTPITKRQPPEGESSDHRGSSELETTFRLVHKAVPVPAKSSSRKCIRRQCSGALQLRIPCSKCTAQEERTPAENMTHLMPSVARGFRITAVAVVVISQCI
jgi:hypothetical protein